jgi:hypothetical protein
VYRQSIEHDQERQERGVAVHSDLVGADGTVKGVIAKRYGFPEEEGSGQEMRTRTVAPF